jgi:hypothetical protein
LVTGQLGGLTLGVDRSVVLRTLGTPTWWEGQSKLSEFESAIWVYNRLEVVFLQNHRADIIRICLNVRHENQFVPDTDMLNPLVFTDINPCAIAEYGSFLEAMRRLTIPFEELTDTLGYPTVRTSACDSKFRKVLHFEESVEAERAVRSSADYLLSISTRG